MLGLYYSYSSTPKYLVQLLIILNYLSIELGVVHQELKLTLPPMMVDHVCQECSHSQQRYTTR